MNQSTILYSSGPPNPWTCIVDCVADGSIVVSSGNKDSDWNLIVPVNALPDLKAALAGNGAVCSDLENISDDAVDMLIQLFGSRRKNPFEDIRTFLASHSIPVKESNWIGH